MGGSTWGERTIPIIDLVDTLKYVWLASGDAVLIGAVVAMGDPSVVACGGRGADIKSGG